MHSIGVSLFARKDQIHFFDEIGYEHAPATHCPRKREIWEKGKCSCSQTASYGAFRSISELSSSSYTFFSDYNANSCMSRWDQLVGYDLFADKNGLS